MIPPKTIKILSDGNELKFLNTIKPNKETHFLYQYVKSSEKLGMMLGLTETELKKLIETNTP